jgi:ATP-dependent exoDNAse (exonuclease V) beta subunit
MMPDGRDQQGQEEYREARRLFYVAVTRTHKELRLVFKRKFYSPWVLELYKRLKGNHAIVVTPAET